MYRYGFISFKFSFVSHNSAATFNNYFFVFEKNSKIQKITNVDNVISIHSLCQYRYVPKKMKRKNVLENVLGNVLDFAKKTNHTLEKCSGK